MSFGKDGGDETSTSTATSAPPDFLLESAENLLGRAETEFATPKQFFPGETVVDFSPETQQAMDMLVELANNPSAFGVSGAGGQALTDILSQGGISIGDIETASQSALDKVIPGTQAQFAQAGRTGSGLAADALGESVTQTIGDVGLDLQQQQTQNQLQALGLVPSFEGLAQVPAQQLAAVGAAQEGKAGERIAADAAKFGFEQDAESQAIFDMLAVLMGISPTVGGTTTGSTTQPSSGDSSGFGSLLGGIAGTLFGGPIGGAAGSQLGGNVQQEFA